MTETRALLLTDIVDSTKLSEQLGDAAMAALWAAHDQVARDLLPVHNGREIDKTDGFLLLFDAAPDAVAYALDYHQALRTLDPPLKARAGLHVGEVILTENAPAVVARGAKPLEVDGIAKPTAARVMGLASGGQTLLTPSAITALGDTPHRVQSHGHWRMKGVSEPLELFEVGDQSAPFTPPPDGAKVYRVVEQPSAGPGENLWLPVKEVKCSLPAERNAFVGRQSDLLALARRLDGDARLVTVLGIGGTGKTRLVTRYGWTWLGDYPGGVWFCDLSEARSIDGIVSAVARVMDVPLGKGDSVVQLGNAIAGRGRCLVLLDNFEQVARHADDTLGHWLDRASDAQFVVTSREVLGLPGEEALALAPLPASEGSALFAARARSAKRDFEPDDVASIDALVELLDGLPLAIELAAARVRVMPPRKLLDRMSQRFKLLTSSGGRRNRQATLRATLDWSWDLLSADEQAALVQVSVFEGGFTLDAAEAVLALDETWPMDAVQALVDKSLVRQVSDVRFDLLVSVQEYAAERLEASGGRGDAEARHGAHFATFGTRKAVSALARHGGVALRRALTWELDNLVAASRRAIAGQDGSVAATTALAAWAVLRMSGPHAAGAAVLEAALAAATDPSAELLLRRDLAGALHYLGRMGEARALYDVALVGAREVGDRGVEGGVLSDLGSLHSDQGRMDESRAHYDAALAVYREVGDRGAEGNVLVNLGSLHSKQSRLDEAHAHYDAALAVHREVGNRVSEGNVLVNLGNLHHQQGQTDEARAHLDAALAVQREVGNRVGEGKVLGNLGALLAEQGRMEEARAHLDAALVVAREVGLRQLQGGVHANLAMVYHYQGRMDEARTHYDAALAVHREVGNRALEAIVLFNLGGLHLDQGRMDEASDHYAAALEATRLVGNRRLEGYVLGSLGGLHRQEGRLDEARACLELGERLLREVGDRVGLGITLCNRARLEHAEGDLETARATLAAVETLATTLGDGEDSQLGQKLAAARLALDAPESTPS